MWVVKLGGSLAQSSHLPHWLAALNQTNAVIVPGGGPFADAVRTAQAHWHFDETTAHHMAIMAMHQYGRMLAGLCPTLSTATTLDELTASPGLAKIWLPTPALLDEAGIPASWDITSDSLAAWLAGQLGTDNLLLVKSIAAAGPTFNSLQLSQRGWVDLAFPRYAAHSAHHIWLCGTDGYKGLPYGFADPVRYFSSITHEFYPS
jgi:aspartokinase-like uncharacterized kinase